MVRQRQLVTSSPQPLAQVMKKQRLKGEVPVLKGDGRAREHGT